MISTLHQKKIEIKEGLENDPWLISQDDYRRYKDEEEKRNYRVQIGVYEDYAIAQKQVESLRETFMEPIVVLNEFTDEKIRYVFNKR